MNKIVGIISKLILNYKMNLGGMVQNVHELKTFHSTLDSTCWIAYQIA